jgi:hypothetical protein
MVDVSHFKLGKKLGVVNDPRTLYFGRVLVVGSTYTPQAEVSIAHTIQSFPMFKNDAIGDCGVASYGHSVIARERSAQQDHRKVDLTDGDIVDAYSAISGYNPSTGQNDNGVYLLDAANYFRRVGVGHDENGEPHKILAYAKVNLSNVREVKQALHICGGLYIGAGLPISAQSQVGDVWDVVKGDDGEFGSWGGHAMYMLAYDADTFEVVTWGQRQKMTYKWLNAYVDEAYAEISPDYMRASGTTPQGFDEKYLQGFLNGLD